MDFSSIEKYVKMVQKTAHEEKLFKHFTDRSNDVECNKDSVAKYLLVPFKLEIENNSLY